MTNKGKLSCNETGKFQVLDIPGVKQTVVGVSEGTRSKETKSGQQGRRANESTGPKIEEGLRLGGNSFVAREKDPAWLKQRVATFEKIQARRHEELASKTSVHISVTMPDGNTLKGNKSGEPFESWKTSPYDVAVSISQGLADSVSVARVTYESFCSDYSPAEDGMEGQDMLSDAMQDGGVENNSADNVKTLLWDMTRPLVGSVSKMEFLKFEDDQDAKTVFWHSSAHMMGEALEHLFGCKLTIGPPLAGGFYYDSFMGKDTLKDTDREYTNFVHTVSIAEDTD